MVKVVSEMDATFYVERDIIANGVDVVCFRQKLSKKLCIFTMYEVQCVLEMF